MTDSGCEVNTSIDVGCNADDSLKVTKNNILIHIVQRPLTTNYVATIEIASQHRFLEFELDKGG